MCNRLCLSSGLDEIASCFGVQAADPKAHLRPHWNIGAGRMLPVIRWDPFEGRRRLDLMRWGLISAWANNTVIVSTTLDVAAGKNLIQRSAQRCLIPADNFYEWRLADKQPFAVTLANRQIMALAGLWDLRISPPGEWSKCFALLATEPNDLLAPFCRRMPAVLGPDDWDIWLGKTPAAVERVQGLLAPGAQPQLTLWPIDRRVGNIRNDDPSILSAVDSA